jgi:hypothetical protein
MKRTSTIFCILVFLLLVTNSAWSRERRSFYEGSRGRAMGGAQIAVVNDETAILVNPAGLGKLRDFYGTIIDPEFEYSNNLNAMNQSSAITQPFSLASVKDTLEASKETYYHAKSQLFPSFVAKNFGVGIFSNYTLDAEMNAAGTNIDAFYRSDIAFVMGYNLRFFDGRIKLGVNAKLLNRIELDNPLVDPSLGLDNTTLGTSEGTGLSTDLGLIMTAPWATLPTISAVVRDMGGTTFDKVSGVRLTSVNRPTAVAQDVDVALAFFPIHSNNVRSTWTIEYRGLLTSSTETDKAKLVHGGMEFNISDIFFVRAGYNQRYYTAGFEVASERMQFQFTTYGEEIGNETSPREDRRTMFKFAFRY